MSEVRHKCKVHSLREGVNNIVVQIVEQGCPPASFPFEVEYHKPVARSKNKPAEKEKVTIKKRKELRNVSLKTKADHESLCNKLAMKINVSSVCDIGIERTNNEDAVGFCFDLKNHLWNQSSTNDYIPLPTEGAVFVVADGMGGANAGEIASNLAIQSIKDSLGKDGYEMHNMTKESIYSFLKKAL